MAFSLAYTHPMDNTSGASQQLECRNALNYFFGTFLPARGWTTIQDDTYRWRTQYPVTNILNNNATEMMYGWVEYAGLVFNSVEDATYTTVPGDLGTVVGNIDDTFLIWDEDYSWKDRDWKFWTSDEDNSLYIVTQGNKTWFWGCKPKVAIYRENSTYTTAPSVETYDTHIFFPMPFRWHAANAPGDRNTYSFEADLLMCIEETEYVKPDGLAFARYITFRNQYTNNFMAYIDYNDIRRKVVNLGMRPTRATNTSILITESLNKYFINGTDWWVSYAGASNIYGALAFNFGTTEPDFN